MPVHNFCFSIGVDLQAFVAYSTSFVILRHCKYLLPLESVSIFESSLLFYLVYMSVCEYYLYYYGFVECFNIWIYKSPFSLLYFFFIILLSICESFFFCKFIEILKKNSAGILIESALKLYINLRIANFIILNCSSKNMIFIDIILSFIRVLKLFPMEVWCNLG